jgi:hypothetical protein
MNWGELFAALRFLFRFGFPDLARAPVAQGDDDDVHTVSYGMAVALAVTYDIMGFEVNPGKTFMDKTRDEFLRQVPQQGDTFGKKAEVSGYPARGITGLFWRNPTSRDPPSGLLRMSEQLTQWMTMINRGCSQQRTFEHMLQDMMSGNGLNRTEVLQILSTPRSFGGLGLFRLNSKVWREFSPGVLKRTPKVVRSTIRGIPYELSLFPKDWEDELIDKVSKNLDLQSGGVEIIKGSTRTVPVRYPTNLGFGSPVSLVAYPEINSPTIGTSALEVAIHRKDWDWIQNKYVSLEQRGTSEMIHKHGGRRVWVDWLLGKLPYHPPTVVGWGDLVTGAIFRDLAPRFWGKLLTRSKFTYALVRRNAYECENAIRDEVDSLEVRLGS